MNDTLKYNRDILPKRKPAREVYRDEVKKNLSTGEGADLELVRARVRQRLRRDRLSEAAGKAAVVVIPAVLISLTAWIVVSVDFTTKTRLFQEEKVRFVSTTYPVSGDVSCKTEYFPNGPKAAETYFVRDLKHHTAYSFYESGEVFRTADYYYDTLLRENYFQRNGDTIRRFPKIHMDIPQHVELTLPDKVTRISFDFFDGKIIGGTYQETLLPMKTKQK